MPTSSPQAAEIAFENGWYIIERECNINGIHMVAKIRYGINEIAMELVTPFKLKVASAHIPYFALAVTRFATDTTLTEYGEKRIASLWQQLAKLVALIVPHREELLECYSGWQERARVLYEKKEVATQKFVELRSTVREAARKIAKESPSTEPDTRCYRLLNCQICGCSREKKEEAMLRRKEAVAHMDAAYLQEAERTMHEAQRDLELCMANNNKPYSDYGLYQEEDIGGFNMYRDAIDGIETALIGVASHTLMSYWQILRDNIFEILDIEKKVSDPRERRDLAAGIGDEVELMRSLKEMPVVPVAT